jgi:hypothetical protein
VADSRAADSEAGEPSAAADARHVHGPVLDQFFPRAQAVHHLQRRLPDRRLPHLLLGLQRLRRQLPLLVVRVLRANRFIIAEDDLCMRV